MIFVICFDLFHCIQHIKPTDHPTRRQKSNPPTTLQEDTKREFYYNIMTLHAFPRVPYVSNVLFHTFPPHWVLKYYNVLVYVLIMAILKRLTRCGHLSGQDYIQNQPNTSQGNISVALSVYIHIHANTCITMHTT